MLSPSNKIKTYLDTVNYYLVLNNIKFDAFPEKDSEGNITFTYSCEFCGNQSLGIIGLDKEDNFYGLIADMDRFRYLALEGFDESPDDMLEDEQLWRAALSPVAFVVSMAYPNHEQLKFEMKTRLKDKHWELGRHFTRFVDRRWYPNFILTEESLEIFVRYESYGIHSLTASEQDILKPLLNAKVNKELTIKMLIEECAEWWSHHNGWYYPIAHVIDLEKSQDDKLFYKALVKIMEDIEKHGFLQVLSKFTGLTQEEKNRYISLYLKL